MRALTLAVLFSSLAFGCKQTPPSQEASEQSGAADTAESSSARTSERGSGSEAKGGSESAAELPEVRQVLTAYESIRSALAQDKTQGIQAAAEQLAQAARAGGKKLNGPAQKQLTDIAKAAEALPAKVGGDMEELRKAFGELSRPVVALITAHEKLQKGLHVFECPMAQGYQKWVQNSESINNPYMGKRMLECGAETKWDAS